MDDGPIKPTCILVHGTDSGQAKRTTSQEYAASVEWLCDPASGVSAHSVCGPTEVTRLIIPPRRAYHAREWNDKSIGIELVHAVYTDPVNPQVLEVGAWEAAYWAKLFRIPLVWGDPGFQEHREVPPGIRDGKVDVSALFDHDDFLSRVRRYYQP